MAILNRLHSLWRRAQAVDLEAYLKDFDPAIARKTAEILTEWTGKPRTASPQPLTRPGVTIAAGPCAAREVAARYTWPAAATSTSRSTSTPLRSPAIRIARRAGEGYYNGLTFHRIAPNFVIQGGSPGANEYMGDILHARRGGLSPARHRRHLDARPRHRRRADLRQSRRPPRLDHPTPCSAPKSPGMDVAPAPTSTRATRSTCATRWVFTAGHRRHRRPGTHRLRNLVHCDSIIITPRWHRRRRHGRGRRRARRRRHRTNRGRRVLTAVHALSRLPPDLTANAIARAVEARRASILLSST